ncbi:transporter substrate-binding domain-containing protein [Ancylomarina sp. DW003]|nr:transporter substrate-binding domain-containing protein [Ancylomarina sp. DW003]MDE5423826.1 transporter substrate-binding domain-containing protein [Ancylomarina sp. DW003]
MFKFKYIKLVIPLILMIFLQTCNQNRQTVRLSQPDKTLLGLKHIKLRGKIRVSTDYNSTNYFIYKGRAMGFQYELLKALAEHLDVKLELSVENDLQSAFSTLERGEIDLIGMNLAITHDRQNRFNFTLPHSQSKQVLIQRKKSKTDSIPIIRNQLELGDKLIHVQQASAYVERLENLSKEIGRPIDIEKLERIEVEELIGKVATGEIDYTIADQNVAAVNKNYYPNIDADTEISFPQDMAWALRKGSDDLTEAVNEWLIGFRKTAQYNQIYRKYFLSSRIERRHKSEYFTLKSGKISRYDELIKKNSKLIDWDWRLLSALVSQESHFDPKARSWVGAFGLMQLMPETAFRYDVDEDSKPEENLKAGVKHLKYLSRRLDKILKDKTDKLQFMLASYNVGLGHILDARRLAKKNGQNPDLWNGSVDYYLLNKSKPEFYKDPVVKYGYCRGKEPYNYVRNILSIYDHYQNTVSPDETSSLE